MNTFFIQFWNEQLFSLTENLILHGRFRTVTYENYQGGILLSYVAALKVSCDDICRNVLNYWDTQNNKFSICSKCKIIHF